MKSTKYLSYLLIGLLSLTGCTEKDNSTNNSITNSTNISSSSNNLNTYFNEDDAILLENYFNFKIPYINLEYTIEDYTEYYNEECVIIIFNNASNEDFINYRNIFDSTFTFDEEYDDGTNYWYCYSIDNYYLDLCYDNYTEEIPFIYLQIYDSALNENSSSTEFEGTQTVNGYFNEEDTAYLAEYFDFNVPCVGDYYEIWDYSYEYIDVLFYFNYTTDNDFNSLLEQLNNLFTYEGIEEYSSYTYYYYSNETFTIYAAYDADGYDYPYIIMEIYDSNAEDDSSEINPDYSSINNFVDGYFNEEDAKYLNNYCGFEIPCTGDEYEIYDYTNSYGYLLIYYNYVEEDDYNNLLNILSTNFTEDGTEEYDGYTYYFYIKGNYSISVVYDIEGYDYPYVAMTIGESY